MIKEWLDSYQPSNKEEALQALREIMQEIALAGLCRAGFFEKAAFYGGTALRIFYGLNRFSEDLDFSLLEANPDFSLDKYLRSILAEFDSLGMHVSVKEKQKTNQNNIESAFLKSETIWRELVLEGVIPQSGLEQKANIKIKLEVDTMPPPGFETEEKLLLKPFSFYVKCFTISDLFAGKMHALLFRKWKDNVKGRDWYDMEWYIKKGIPLNLKHFALRAKDSGDRKDELITSAEFQDLLHAKIDSVDLNRIKADISRFIPDPKVLEIWTPQYFHDLTGHLKIKT
ncbi:nucleotidyltransferase AbiEii toxin of type IV toxin-antitoxin system [Arcticibacter tournemirensis]|uniref:Nucleotidyl transferase AbiEii/AbiGii toxin family protein n=1 Tax=Arcticibacter tournemirensis TaxID=699437 RepID=A0A5M9H483_9SPHI|nr:nucleotidyl transferase AbiEii/AbiGii toxin family protein [Arcticibacter tournemirensis]KAA8479974.1 nucleotidyl transferase AbiEii/AbiGii toxin family protein [Arcticibacter tournemirensis]TQM51560.1 nucleotidyltransferase AbiEii toxin of type IV toxin-antitoxin system [Arcticibacter tournemirensis]